MNPELKAAADAATFSDEVPDSTPTYTRADIVAAVAAAYADIDRLTKERDEARTELAAYEAAYEGTTIENLSAMNRELGAERDEARREAEATAVEADRQRARAKYAEAERDAARAALEKWGRK